MPSPPLVDNAPGGLVSAARSFRSDRAFGNGLYKTSYSNGRKSSLCRQQSLQFDEDLKRWISNASGRFHVRIFFREMCGHALFVFFGPLSWPLVFWIYGGTVGLLNRGFWVRRGRFFFAHLSGFVIQFVQWATLCMALTTWAVFRPAALMSVELKLLVVSLFMRNVTIAIKYAYMSSSTWERLNFEVLAPEYLNSLLLARGWFLVPAELMQLHAELSLVGVVGSREQRSALSMKFMSWPRSLEELAQLRQRMDVSSKHMYKLPTGRIINPKSMFRKIETREISNAFEKHSFDTSLLTETNEEDGLVFSKAAEGQLVSIDAIFLYFLRALLRNETAVIPHRPLMAALPVITLATILMPSIMRVAGGGQFFGNSTASFLVVVGMWPSTFVSTASSLLFILVGAKDMWRRRALMRSCAALLSFQHYYRHHCPAEVMLLPVLDLTDPHTIEAWAKLRQLCHDWGRFYQLRIGAFATVFACCTFVMLLDTLAVMYIMPYRTYISLNLTDLFVMGLLSFMVLISVVVLVYFGNEVNESSARHVFLLTRQRLLATSRRHRGIVDSRLHGVAAGACNDDDMERMADFLDVLCADITAEHQAHPVRLLGSYCGYSLLSALYFIPLSFVSTLITFCSRSATAKYCSAPG